MVDLHPHKSVWLEHFRDFHQGLFLLSSNLHHSNNHPHPSNNQDSSRVSQVIKQGHISNPQHGHSSQVHPLVKVPGQSLSPTLLLL